MMLRPQLVMPDRAVSFAPISPTNLVLLEHVMLALIFLPMLFATHKSWKKLEAREWGALLFLGCCGSAIATILYTTAFTYSSPAMVILLQKTQPLFALVLAGVVLKEKRAAWFWLWGAAALLGTLYLTFGDRSLQTLADELKETTANPHVVGRLYALSAAAVWGTCTVVGRHLATRVPAGAIAAWRFTLALPVLFAMSIAQGGFHAASFQMTGHAEGLLVAIVLIPDLLGMCLYYVGLRSTPASMATLCELAYPATAVMFALLTDTSHLSVTQWTGFAVLCVSVYAMQVTRAVTVPAFARTVAKSAS